MGIERRTGQEQTGGAARHFLTSVVGGLIVCVGCSSDDKTPPAQQPIAPGGGGNVRPQGEKLDFHPNMTLEKEIVKRAYGSSDLLVSKRLITRQQSDYWQENVRREYSTLLDEKEFAKLTPEQKMAFHEAIVQAFRLNEAESYFDISDQTKAEAVMNAVRDWAALHAFEKARTSVYEKKSQADWVDAINLALRERNNTKALGLIDALAKELRAATSLDNERFQELLRKECEKAGVKVPSTNEFRNVQDQLLEMEMEPLEKLRELLRRQPDA